MVLNIKKIFNSDFKNVLLLIIYFFLLLDSYYFVYDTYAHIGFDFDFDFSSNNSLISYISFFLIILFRLLIYFLKKSDYTTLDFILVLFTIPALVFFYHNAEVPFNFIISYILLPIIFGLISLGFSKPKFPIIDINFSKGFLLSITLIFIIPVLLIYGVNLDFSLFSLGGNIYDVRLESFEKSGRFIGYSISWLSNVILPISLIYFLRKKKYLLVFISLIILIYLFLTFAQKSNFFAIFLVLFFYFVKNKRKGFNYVILFMIVLISLLLISTELWIFPIALYLLYRILFIQIEITSFYFDFFENNHTYLSQSIFNPFLEYNYSVTPSNLIGELYFGNSLVSANTGIIGDAFMNFGYVGIIIYLVIFSFLILKLASKIPNIYYGLLLIQLFSFQNSPLTTVLVTHGFLFFWILLNISNKVVKNSS